MKKADKYLPILLKSGDYNPVPEVVLNKSKEEHFILVREKKQVRIVASNARLAAFAINQIKLGIESKVNYYPQILFRPLFLYGTHLRQLTPSVQIALPDLPGENWKNQLELLCQRTIGFGYNALIFGFREGTQWDPDALAFESEFFDIIKEYDLKIIVKPLLLIHQKGGKCPLDMGLKTSYEETFLELKRKFPKVDDLFFESNYLHKDFFHDPQAGMYTCKELILEEIRLLSKFCHRKLLYYIPVEEANAEKASGWILDLMIEIPKNVLLVFSATKGNPVYDHLPSHPIWSKISKLGWNARLPLLPILNFGGIHQGEGLWTLYNLDLVENYLSRAIQSQMEGVISLASTLPLPESFLGLSLWLSSRMMWDAKQKISWLVEKWHQAYHPDWSLEDFLMSLITVRQLSLKLSLLRTLIHEPLQEIYTHEDYRIIAETLHYRLTELNYFNEKKKEAPIKDSIHFFVRDAKNILSHFLQVFNLSILGIQAEKDVQEAFWTMIQKGTGGKKIVLLNAPQLPFNEKMKQIYQPNRL